MSWKLFIDDERFPVGDGWIIARSSDEAISLCKEYGFPNYISFDHDLGGDDTSMKFIHWLIETSMDYPNFSFPRKYSIHSANPVGVKNIDGLLQSYIRHLDKA
jgi:hypothetical protein